MKTIQETSLLTIRKGDRLKIKEDDRVGQLIDIYLAPNRINDSIIVAVLTLSFKNGDKFSATSDKFIPVENDLYCERIYY